MAQVNVYTVAPVWEVDGEPDELTYVTADAAKAADMANAAFAIGATEVNIRIHKEEK